MRYVFMVSEAEADPNQAAARPRWRRLAWAFALLAGLVSVLIAAAYVERKPIAALLVQAYLLKYGITSSVEFEQLSRGGFVAHVRTGPDMPDFSAEVLDVTLESDGLFVLPRIGTVRLVRPVLRARFDGKRLSFGSLQRLIDEALAKQPEGPGPSVTIEGGVLYLATPMGALQFGIDATVDKGKLNRLTAELAATELRNAQFRAGIKGARFAATVVDDKLDGTASFRIAALSSSGPVEFSTSDLEGSAELRGVEWRRSETALQLVAATASLALKSASLESSQNSATQPDLKIALDSPQLRAGNGQVDVVAVRAAADLQSGRIGSSELSSGSLQAHLVLENPESHLADSRSNLIADHANVILASSAFTSSQATAGKSDIRLDLNELNTVYESGALHGSAEAEAVSGFRDVRVGPYLLNTLTFNTSMQTAIWQASPQDWSITGPLRAVFDARALRYPFRRDTITLASLYGAVTGSSRISATGITGALHGSAAATASMPRRLAQALAADVPIAGSDPKLAAAIANALAGAKLQIPDLNISRSDQASTLQIAKPISLAASDGARVEISPEANHPLLEITSDTVDGGFSATANGGGLPELSLKVPAYRVSGKGRMMTADASAVLDATLDYGAFKNLHVSMDGVVRQRNAALTIALQRCADVLLGAYDANGMKQVTGARGQICADARAPLLQSESTGWRLQAAWTQGRAKLEQAQSTIDAANGKITLNGDAAGLHGGRVDVATALLSDTLTPLRYRPVTAAGAMILTGQDWSGTFDVSTHQRKLAAVQLHHAMDKGAGSASIKGSDILFDPMFQPTDISPLLASLGTRVRGHASFSGSANWNMNDIQTTGTVRILDVDVQTLAGMARGVRGDIALSSLIPVTFAPRQTITVNRLDWPVPVEQISARFSLTPEHIQLEQASGRVAGGNASLEPLTYSFAPDATTQSTLRFEHIDLNPIIAAAGLAGKVTISARIGGTLPFTFGPDGLRFANGHIAAESPGRLSIQRAALTAAVGTSAAGEAQANAVQDFAYQALENLSFSELTGEVNSRPMGRLGVLLHVKGENDPPQSTETRVGLAELLQGHAFDKPLPLPKGTPIDLTLDTSVNLDELLASYFGQERRMSAAAQ